jgi:membrane protein
VERVDEDRTNSGPRRRLATLRQVKADLTEHNLTLVSAGVAFYALLAIFPAVVAMVLVYALVARADQVEGQLEPVLRVLPSEAGGLLLRQLEAAAAANDNGLTIGLVISLLATLWAATGGMSALMTGLNVAYGVRDERGFVKVRAAALALTLGALVSAVVALGLIAAFPVVLDRVGLDPARAAGAQVARWGTLAVLVAIGLSVLYRFGPHRPHARWRPLTVGATVAIVVWIAVAAGFSLYVSTFGSYSRTYGSLAAVIVLLMWLYLSAFAVLLGAEVDAVRARRHAPDAAGTTPNASNASTGTDEANREADAAASAEGPEADADTSPARQRTVAAAADMAELAELNERLNAARIVGTEVTVAQAAAVAANDPVEPVLPRTPGRHRHSRVGFGSHQPQPTKAR